jgi:hypothetical protein
MVRFNQLPKLSHIAITSEARLPDDIHCLLQEIESKINKKKFYELFKWKPYD